MLWYDIIMFNNQVLHSFLREDLAPEALPLLISTATSDLPSEQKELTTNLLKTKG